MCVCMGGGVCVRASSFISIFTRECFFLLIFIFARLNVVSPPRRPPPVFTLVQPSPSLTLDASDRKKGLVIMAEQLHVYLAIMV